MEITIERLMQIMGEQSVENIELKAELRRAYAVVKELKMKAEAVPASEVQFEGKNGLCIE